MVIPEFNDGVNADEGDCTEGKNENHHGSTRKKWKIDIDTAR